MPFEIPESWVWVTLEDIFYLQAGKFISASEIYNEDDGNMFPCYGGNGLRGFVKEYNRNGDYPLIGRQGALCGNINFAQGEFYATEHAVVVETFANTNVKWAIYFLIQLNLNQYATATAQPGLSVNKINNVLIPIPPLPEQHRIVQKIEELLPLVERYDQTEQKLTKLNDTFPEQLKKSVLQAAIQGKLTEQLPTDEPASELLKRIEAEKMRLISEGKLKKPRLRDNSQNAKFEPPFEIPQGWEWVRLGDIGEWGSGATPSRHEPKFYENGTIPWLKTGDLNDGIITEIPEYITPLAVEKSSVKLNPIGSVLIAMYGATIGKLGILNIEATTNQACCACIPYNGIYNKFLFYYLMSQKTEFQKCSEGSGQPNISKEKIISSLFPLPPIQEQKRIVEKVELLLSQIERL